MLALAVFGVIATQQSMRAQHLAWSASHGSEGDDVARSIAVDPAGNVLVAGYFESTVDLDPGSGQLLRTSNGMNDIYVQKLTSDGDLIWALSFGGSGMDLATGVSTDVDGNVFITGAFHDVVDMDPGAGVSPITSNGDHDIFLAKYSPAGDLLWAKAFGSDGYEESTSVAAGALGNVHLLSYFNGSLDADPGAGELPILAVGSLDILIQKFNSDGDLVWARSLGSSGTELGISLTLDAQENIWFTGSFEGTLDFDPGAASFPLTSAGAWDIFVANWSADGDLLWAGRMGGVENFDIGYDIAIDPNGNVVVVGSFFGSGDFDPGAGVHTLTASSAGTDEVFVVKLDPSGELIWAVSFGGQDADLAYGVTISDEGNIAVTGYFSGTADLDPDANVTFELTTSSPDNFFDAYVCELDPDGDFLRAWKFGGASSISGGSIARGAGDVIYVAGHFEMSPDFDPGAEQVILNSAGFRDAFLVRFDALTVGLQESIIALEPLVFPNPANDHVVFQVHPTLIGARYIILDLQGRPVARGILTDPRTRIDVDRLAAGTYQFKVSDRSRSFVVMH